MTVEMIPEDWIHRWFNLFDGGLGYFWCGCLTLVALWLGFVWCWPDIQKIQHRSAMIAELKVKAYRQGYHAGLNNLPWSLDDWEAEFRAEYRRGLNDGLAARGNDTNE